VTYAEGVFTKIVKQQKVDVDAVTFISLDDVQLMFGQRG